MKAEEFVAESNKIERITRPPKLVEIQEHVIFINLPVITLKDLLRFVEVYQPNARLRDKFGLDVLVGHHMPPLGSPNMGNLVEELLDQQDDLSAYELHVRYESLHPFTDCNGRSGRALWAWKMMQTVGHYSLGFLHHFYYQALDASRVNK